jgi:hypothetical protein
MEQVVLLLGVVDWISNPNEPYYLNILSTIILLLFLHRPSFVDINK